MQNENIKLASKKDTDPEPTLEKSDPDEDEQEIDELAPRQLRKIRTKTVKFNPNIYQLEGRKVRK